MATDTKPDAQVDAQDRISEAYELDHPREETALLNQVMGRHDLSNKWLARECDLTEGYVSRIRSGEYPVSVRMFSVLFRETLDERLLAFVAASRGDIRVISAASNPEEVIALGLDLMKKRQANSTVSLTDQRPRSPLNLTA